MGAREVEASVGQRLLWLLDHYRGEDGELNEPMIQRIRGPLDVGALRRAVDELSARHEVLRTTFASRGRRLVQVVHDPAPVELIYEDLSSEPDPEGSLWAALYDEGRTRIDPTVSSIRVRLWRTGEAEHVFCLNMHHLVTDEWSAAIVARDLAWLYNGLVADGPPLPPVRWQFAEWSDWQRRLFAESLPRLREYWYRQLDGVQFPALPRRRDASGDPADVRVEGPPLVERAEFPREVVEVLREIARSRRTTLFPAALAVLYAQLWRLTGQEDLAVASLFANRARPEVRETPGFFVNMLVLRNRVDVAQPFTRLVQTTRNTVVEALEHQALPYQMLPPSAVRDERRSVRADDVVFHLVEVPEPPVMLAGLEVEPIPLLLNRKRFALELALVPSEDGFSALVLFGEDEFERGFARELAEGFVELARALAVEPDVPLGAVEPQVVTA